jgi:hypothetical protein
MVDVVWRRMTDGVGQISKLGILRKDWWGWGWRD